MIHRIHIFIEKFAAFEADAMIAATCNSLRNDLLELYICKHLFEADSILINLVRYDDLLLWQIGHSILKEVGSGMTPSPHL